MHRSLVVVPLLAAALAASVAACGAGSGPEADTARQAPPKQGLVGSESCAECHAHEHATWRGTLHAETFVAAGPETVLADFHGRPIDLDGQVVTPYRDGDELRMEVEGGQVLADVDHRVDFVVGRGFEQGFLSRDEAGALRLLPLSWNVAESRWDATHHVLLDIAGQAAHGPAADVRDIIFNEGCAHCHATGFDPGLDLDTGAFDSHWPEGSVSCESCHGEGGLHVAWHRDGRGEAASASLVHPYRDLDAQQVADSCGRCHYLHEWRYAVPSDARVGHNDIAVSRNLDRAGFHPDGRLAGLNYHGSTLSQSPCFVEGGMSCLHCHDLHGGRPRGMRFEDGSSQMCAGCHDDLLADPTAHSHHAAEGDDAVGCLDCHMPRYLDGVLSFQRDHSLTSPEPELTERFGSDLAPNACTDCHADQEVAWSREWRERWWGPTEPRRVEEFELVVALRSDPGSVPTARLEELAADDSRRRFVRLTALDNLAARGASRVAVELLTDDDPEVRQLSVEALSAAPRLDAQEALVQALHDPVRTVRLEACFALGRLGWRGDVFHLAEDVHALLDRQAPSLSTLDRVLVAADLLEDDELFDRAWPAWRRRLVWPAPTWTPIEIDLVGRRARRILEELRAEDALILLEQARSRAGEAFPPWLEFDRIWAQRRLGRVDMAVARLVELRDTAPPDVARVATLRLGLEWEPPEGYEEAAPRLGAGELELRALRQ